MPVYYDEPHISDHGKLRTYKTAGRTLAIFAKNAGVVRNLGFIVVNRHSFVRAALHECLRQPRGTKMSRFPPSPMDQPKPPATKSAIYYV